MNNNTKLLAIQASIYEMGLRFNQQPTIERIIAYSKDLAEFSPDQIVFAFRQVINGGSAFFPSLAEILAHLKPPTQTKEDLAPSIAMEVINAIRQFSQWREDDMLESVSGDARLVFKALGSTQDIRNSENFETMKAQLERTVKSVLSTKDYYQKTDQLSRIGIKMEPVANKAGLKVLEFADYLPKDEK